MDTKNNNDADVSELEEVFEFNNTVVIRDETGRCWALSPGNFMGNIDEDKLKLIGNFRIEY